MLIRFDSLLTQTQTQTRNFGKFAFLKRQDQPLWKEVQRLLEGLPNGTSLLNSIVKPRFRFREGRIAEVFSEPHDRWQTSFARCVYVTSHSPPGRWPEFET